MWSLEIEGSIASCPMETLAAGRRAAVVEFQARSALAVSGVVDVPTWQKLLLLPEPSADVPSRGVAFICREEVSSREYYDAHSSTPTWPGGASGVTMESA